MDLAQLYKKHEQDNELFNTLRDKVWSDVKKKHEQIISSFGTKESLPDPYSKQIKTEQDNFTKDWAIPHGLRYKAMLAQQQQQFKSLVNDILLEDPSPVRTSNFERSLASTKAKVKSLQRQKSPEKFINLDQNKKSMDLDMG